MISNSDEQIWHNAVNGINESGRIDLIEEEWAALKALNDCLANSNFQSNESSHSIMLLKNNLSRHGNNPVLQTHLQSFIALCDRYGTAHQIPLAPPQRVEEFDLSNCSRDGLLHVLRTSLQEITKYNTCYNAVDNCEKRINEEKKIIGENKNKYGGLIVVIVLFIIIVLVLFSTFDLDNARLIFLIFLFNFGIPAFFVLRNFFAKRRKSEKAEAKLAELETKLPGLLKKAEDAINEFAAILLIPEDYRYEYALANMLKYIENGRATDWVRVTDLYENHLHQKRVEESFQIAAEEARKQTEIAIENLSATRWAAAGAWASAAGIWRINSKL